MLQGKTSAPPPVRSLVGQSYRRELIQGESFDVAVIGSGIGSLCAAAILAKAGQKVLVLERHYVAGGFTHVFKRKGYEWDVGVHYVGDVNRQGSLLRRLFDYITDGELEWAPMADIYDTFYFGDDAYEFPAGVKRFRKALESYFPGEKRAIDGYLRQVGEVRKAANPFFVERALPFWLGRMVHRFTGSKFLRYARRTTLEVLQELTGNQKLIGVLTGQYGDYGLPPGQSSFAMHALLARHFIDGGNYPVGGGAAIARTIAPVIAGAGGRILVRAEVDKILVHRNRALGVRLHNGDEIRCRTVVSGAGAMTTFGKLLGPEISSRAQVDRQLDRLQPSTCHICLYVGVRESDRTLQLQTSNRWAFPGYDHDQNIASYLEDPSQPLPVTYISFPSAKDPDWEKRYPGRSTIEVLSFAPYDWFVRWENSRWQHRGQDYEAYKESLTNRLIGELYKYVPEVEGKVDYRELSTPLTTAHFSNYQGGAIYGLEHSPDRFGQRWLRPQTSVKNLYLTGQDIVTGGVAGALFAGLLTASAILKRNLFREVLVQK